MSITVGDPILGSGDGRASDNPGYSIKYLPRGTGDIGDTDAAVMAAVLAAAPSTYEGLPIIGAQISARGGWVWEVEVEYRPSSFKLTPKPVAGDPNKRSFSSKGGTQNIKASLETVWADSAGGLAVVPDFGNLINVTDDGVEGVDIVVPGWRETITRYLDNATVTGGSFKATIYGLTGKVNDDTFLGFEAGEVLFLGVDASQRDSDGVWEITYEFEARPNRTGIEVSDIPAFDQEGWHYAWFRTMPADEGAGITRKPSHVYVERVYESGDFSALGVS